MRSGDQPDINLMSAVAAESLKFLLLQNAQQFRLKFERDVADFVQKERALVRQFKASHFLSDRSGKCSFFVTEQLTLQKPERNRGAIQFDEGAFAAGAQIVYRAGDQLLAGSGLAQDQHARIRRRDNGYQLQRGLQSGALSHDCPTLSANFLLEVESLFRFFISILYRLFVLQRVLNGNRHLTGHLLEQDDVVFLKSIVRTPGEHQNANHAVAAYERKITAGSEAFLDHALIKTLAVRIPINFRILADLFEAIDPDALGRSAIPDPRSNYSSAPTIPRARVLSRRDCTGW